MLEFQFADRRGFLRASFASAGALAATAAGSQVSAGVNNGGINAGGKAVIHFFMAGGPSHIDLYDLKPEASAEIRGPFAPIATNTPGIEVCELMPRQAQIADRLAIVRSVTHDLSNHDDATHWLQTGYPLLGARQRGQTHPAQGAVISRLTGPRKPGAPAYVAIPEDYRRHMGFYEGPAYLGARHAALDAGGDPSLGNYRPPAFQLPVEVPLPRLDDRRNLLRSLDRLAQNAETNSSFRAVDDSLNAAVELSTGAQIRQAFDLSRETAALRVRYGLHAYGQGALLARRLVEAGATYVVINLYEKDVDWWDDHYTIEKNLRTRLPRYDQALAALIEDLTDRGLLASTLVAAFGEFGRAPRIDSGAGRGHWPGAMAAVLAGGGVRGGQIIGRTTPDGAKPAERPLRPEDLLASIYRVLGVDPSATLPDVQQRPIPLLAQCEGIPELF